MVSVNLERSFNGIKKILHIWLKLFLLNIIHKNKNLHKTYTKFNQ